MLHAAQHGGKLLAANSAENSSNSQTFKQRFMPDKNDFEAAKEMNKIIEYAEKNLRTILYDEIQYLQNKIRR